GRPSAIFGEQVASASEWLGLVRSDLEALVYAMAALPIEAAGAGAYHLRDRYWFVAYSKHSRREGRHSPWQRASTTLPSSQTGLADSDGTAIRFEPRRRDGSHRPSSGQHSDDCERPLPNTTSEQVGSSGQPWQCSDVADGSSESGRLSEHAGWPSD